MSNRFNKIVEDVLVKSGWHYGRKVESMVSEWEAQIKRSDNIEMFPKAREILTEFGGIKVESWNNYSKVSFEIDPAHGIGEGDRFEEYANLLKVKIYPLGEAFGGHYFLGVIEDGRVVWVGNGLFIIGNDFDEALTRMILERNPEPIEIHY